MFKATFFFFFREGFLGSRLQYLLSALTSHSRGGWYQISVPCDSVFKLTVRGLTCFLGSPNETACVYVCVHWYHSVCVLQRTDSRLYPLLSDAAERYSICWGFWHHNLPFKDVLVSHMDNTSQSLRLYSIRKHMHIGLHCLCLQASFHFIAI